MSNCQNEIYLTNNKAVCQTHHQMAKPPFDGGLLCLVREEGWFVSRETLNRTPRLEGEGRGKALPLALFSLPDS